MSSRPWWCAPRRSAAGRTAPTSASTRTPPCSSRTAGTRAVHASSAPSGASFGTRSSCASSRSPRRCSDMAGKRKSLHVKKGDLVVVIAGKDKGVTGKVIAAYPEDERVLVEGVNRIKKHTKVGQTARGAKTGGIVTTEAPIHVSNVMIAVEKDGKRVGTRVGIREEQVERDGRVKTARIRVAKRTGEDI